MMKKKLSKSLQRDQKVHKFLEHLYPKKIKKIFSCGVLIEKGTSKKVQTQFQIKGF